MRALALLAALGAGLLGCAAQQPLASEEPPIPPVPAVASSAQPPSAAGHGAVSRRLAVTIDDLPWHGGVAPGDSSIVAMGRLILSLQARHTPAMGFVTCHGLDRDDGEPLVNAWLQADFSLGNHSTGHRHLDEIPFDDWRCDLRSCRAALESLGRAPVPYFRFPFLQTGRTMALRESAMAFLHAEGMKPAPVSIDTADWVLAEPYVKARGSGDGSRATRLCEAYRAHVMRAVGHYADYAQAKWHRDVSQVLLIHATSITADCLGPTLDEAAAQGWSFTSLEEALKDPVYGLDDGYAGPVGLSWLYRVGAGAAAVAQWRWDEAEQQQLEALATQTP